MNRLWLLVGRVLYFPAYPLAALYLLNSRRVRVVVTDKSRVLIVKPWLNNGRWDLPGGGLHEDENPSQGAVRELREELGLKIDFSAVKIHKQEDFRAGLLRYSAIYAYVVLDSSDSQFLLQKHEISDYKWVNAEELNQISMISPSLNRYASEVLKNI